MSLLMLSIELDNVTEVRLLHSAKASCSMLVTEFGIITDVRLLQ